jgi:hypothetical protein
MRVLVAPRAGNPDTWAENDMFRLLLLFDFAKSYGGLPPDFLWSLVALANFMRLSLLKAAHAAVGECHVAGNPGRPSYSAHVR